MEVSIFFRIRISIYIFRYEIVRIVEGKKTLTTKQRTVECIREHVISTRLARQLNIPYTMAFEGQGVDSVRVLIFLGEGKA